MKNFDLRKTLLGVALLGNFAAPLATSVAQAAPRDYAPAYGRRAQNRNNERYDRNRYDNDRDYRARYDNNRDNDRNNATYSGTVTNVRAGNNFDLSANGRTYNVYTPSGVPRGLSEGDTVRVYGRPYGDNDVRNANVVIVNNSRDNNGRDNYNNGNYNNGRYNNGNYTNGRYDPNGKLGGYGNGNYGNASGYQTFTGIVTNVDNDREFDIRIGASTYNVYASSSAPRLSDGDTVRVYGERYGDNDIRNANVTVTRDDNNGDYGRYQNFTGVVTDVTNDREFNVRIGGQTYNVYAATSTRDLNEGDEVRIYGQRYGDNDIRNANARITRNR